MKKNTRININTSFKIYIKVFLSFIFNQGKKNKEKLKILLQKFFSTNNLLLTSQGRVAAFNIFKVILSDKKKRNINLPLYPNRNYKRNYIRWWKTNLPRN